MLGSVSASDGLKKQPDDLVGVMFKPTDPRIVNGHVIERTREDQELINEFARTFLLESERKMIASILARDERDDNLAFTTYEAEIIANRHDPAFLSGTSNTGEYGFPIAQFYDFVFTIDNALTFLRGLHVEVMNLRTIGSLEHINQLKKSIIHEDGVPWEIADLPNYKTLPDETTPDKPGKSVLRFDSDFIAEKDDTSGHWFNRERTNYEKCVDEALIYDSPIYRLLIGLQQGLFLVKHTVAEKLRYEPMDQPPAPGMTKEFIPIGNWINCWHSMCTHVIPYCGKAKDANTAEILRAEGVLDLLALLNAGKGHSKLDNTLAAFMAGPMLSHWYFMPKVYDVRQYPANWPGRLLKDLGGSAADATSIFQYGPKVSLELLPKGHVVPAGGGPIAYWNCNIYPHLGGGKPDTVNVWMRVEHDRIMGNHDWLLKNSRLLPSAEYPEAKEDATAYQNIHAIETDWNAVSQAMTERHVHPIWACARLSKAFASSGVASVLQNMYRMIQQHFLASYKNTDQMAMAKLDARRILMSSGRSLQYMSPGSCPGNTLPRYVTFGGKIVDEADATFVNNGVRYIRSHVDPSRCSCQPMVRALSYTTSETDRNRMSTQQPHTMSIRMPIGGPMTLTPDEIERQINSKSMMFTQGAGSVTGGALMSALTTGVRPTNTQRVVGGDDVIEDTSRTVKHTRVSRKNNPDYQVVYRTNKNGVKQRFYVHKTKTTQGHKQSKRQAADHQTDPYRDDDDQEYTGMSGSDVKSDTDDSDVEESW